MTPYRQGDHDWADKQLAPSDWRMSNAGCTVTCVAQALTLAGYGGTPGTLVDALSSNGGFTDSSYSRGAGLLYWGAVQRLYPEFRFGDATGPVYTFIEGTFGRSSHWVLRGPDGTLYDPWGGTNEFPAGFHPTGYTRFASISKLVNEPQPGSPAPDYPKLAGLAVDGLRVRRDPNTGAAILGTLNNAGGTVLVDVTVKQDCGDYWKIKYYNPKFPDISEAYVVKKYQDSNPPHAYHDSLTF